MGLDEAMNALARLMSLKYENLTSGFYINNSERVSVGHDTPHDAQAFRLGGGGGGVFECCTARDQTGGNSTPGD